MLARETEKRNEAQAGIQVISGLLQDCLTNTMSALRHWEQDRNAGVQFGSYSPLPLDSSHPSGNFQSQDDVRYMYQQPQQTDAAQFSDVFQTPAPDGDPWSF